MDIYFKNREIIVENLKVIWNYMNLNMPLSKSDIIIGCGCSDLDIPVKCAELYKDGYAPLILFAGGVGKITKKYFPKSEAEIFKEIAIKEGVPEEKILVETKSTNTGDNFRYSLELLKQKNIDIKKILIVHHSCAERRTYSTAKAIIKDKEILITSSKIKFSDFIKNLESKPEKINDKISVLVGDIQRILIYPQFGWQEENEMPKGVIESYNCLKNLGFNKFIISKEGIQKMIDDHGLTNGQKANYFN